MPTIKDNNRKISFLNLLGKCYKRSFLLEEARKYFQKAIQLNESTNNSYYVESILGMGDTYALEHKLDSTLYYTQLIAEANANTNKYKGHYLFNLGKSYLSTNSARAEDLFVSALKSFDPRDDEILILYVWLADMLIEENRIDEGYSYIREALLIQEKFYPANKILLAYIHLEIGFYYHAKGDLKDAIKSYKDTETRFLRNDSTIAGQYYLSEVNRLMNLSYELLGDYDNALRCGMKNLVLKEKLSLTNKYKISEALLGLAKIYYHIGISSKALTLIEQAIPFFIESKSQIYLAQCFLIKGAIYFESRHFEESIIQYELANSAIANSNILTSVPFIVNFNKSMSLLHMSKTYEAKLLLDQTITDYTEIYGERIQLASYLMLQGLIFQKLKTYDSADYSYKKALKLFTDNKISEHRSLTWILNIYLSFLIDHHSLQDVEYLLKRAFKSNASNYDLQSIATLDVENSRNVYESITTCYLAAKYFQKTYQYTKDKRYLLKSIELITSIVNLIENKKKSYQYRISDKLFRERFHNKIYIQAISVIYDIVTLENNSNYLSNAFMFIGKGKSSVLLENLNENIALEFRSIPDSTRIQESSLISQLLYLKTSIKNLGEKANELSQLNSFKTELIAAEIKYDSLITHLEQNYPEYYNLKYNFDVLSIKDVQQKLKTNEALIEYFNGENQTYAFTITKDTAHFQTLPMVEEAGIEGFRAALNPDFINKEPGEVFTEYTESAYHLHQKILAPLLENIDNTKINTLKIIPDGLLSLVPFETLITAPHQGAVGDYKSLSYLMKQFNISYGYSATSLFKMSEMKKEDMGSNVLAFAPTTSLSSETASLNPLRWNQSEIDDITQFFNTDTAAGLLATESSFKEKIQQYPIAHLAMHAVVNNEDPMYSKLLFAPPQDTLEDGMLHTFELYNMRLNTQMVVLSACNTGYGKLQKGEGVMSLSRAFAYAGCPSIVMSHWSVDDKATATLMKYFYQHLAEGEDKDVALKNAKLDFLNNSSPLYHHPYFWNNFVVLGDVKPVRKTDHVTYWILAIFVGLVLVVFAYYALLKHRGRIGILK
ncbi:hypothetical protein C900_05771 [Fulvivirga imtechensis AK7]|uniref:CHAT domain-containing protein n=2 Tax=Fulvivirga TaxID=396811 RepID=L8JVQ8_9BACT|nr:hypothetical protein C900_05771 [Fulvivirga imtechensis AK7]